MQHAFVRSETHILGLAKKDGRTYLVCKSIHQLDIVWEASLLTEERSDIDRTCRTRLILQPLKIDFDLVLVTSELGMMWKCYVHRLPS